MSPSTYYRAMQATTPRHAAFRDAVVQAQTELEIRLVATIAAEATQPRWALALLERRFRARWGRASPQEPAPAEPIDEAARPADDVVSLDPALVPRLLEARDRLAARASSTRDLSRFEERRPRWHGRRP